MLRNQRRIGEALMVFSGIGIAIGGYAIGLYPLSYGGLAIMSLGIVSVFWR